LSAYRRAAATTDFSAGGCVLGAFEVVVGVEGLVAFAAKEVGGAGGLRPAAVFTAVVSRA
jgi:hypothetical protein